MKVAAPRRVSMLDRFDIDYALCMYCGICVEVCPFDALFWSPEFEYSESSIAELLHDKDKLGEWMETVPEPEPLEIGAEVKGKKYVVAAERRLLDPRGRDGRSPRSASCARRTSCTPRCTSWSCSRARAAQYILLAAEFVAWVQVLVYIGAVDRAVPVRHHAHPRADAPERDARQRPALAAARSSRCSSSACSPRCSSTRYGDKEIKLDDADAATAERHATRSSATTSSRSKSSSMLLLAALVGAVVMARRD